MKFRLLCIFLSLFSLNVFSQENLVDPEIQKIAEELTEDESDSESSALYLESLNELSDDRVKINTGDDTEISRLFFLSDFQVKALADYVRSTGKIVSLQEIALIPGFDQKTVLLMSPFITLENGGSVNNLTTSHFNSTLLTNMTIKPGDRDTSMPGSQLKVLTKYKIQYGNFIAGFTTEKDQGEKYLAHDNLPDFLSGYFAWSGKGMIKEVVLGDFSARTGIGSCINTGMKTSISLSSGSSLQGSDDIKPYTSTNENNFFRGAAIRIAARNVGAILFYSRNKIDASLACDTDSQSIYVESLYQAGLHNSQTQLLKKDVLIDQTFGINIRYEIKKLRIGATWSGSSFSYPLNLRTDDPGYLFRFTGASHDLYSIYYKTQVRNIFIYGEVSSDRNFNSAIIQGLAAKPSDRFSISMLYRDYCRGFTSFHGYGPGSSTSNEKGILGSFTLEAASHLFISGGVDFMKYPWLRYRTSFPSASKRSELRIRYEPDEKVNFDFSVYTRSSMLDDDEKTGVPAIKINRYIQVKSLFRFSPVDNLTLSSRVLYKRFMNSHDEGYLFSQDATYNLKAIPLSIWVRYCLFNTSSWDSRLYIYENDLLYSFSVPALSGEGTRSYIMLKYEFKKIVECRIKYSFTSVNNKNLRPEYNDELKLQIRFWF